jgi:putative acetyltransferase
VITIRRYTSGDAPALWAVYCSAIRQVASKDYSKDQIDAWAPANLDPAMWATRMEGIAPFVAERDGEIVGYADVQPNGYIDHFFVAGGATRQGIGSRLMEQLHSHAASLGLESLFAHVSITARPFFERWGFEVEQQQSLAVSGVSLTNFQMRKSQLTTKWSPRLGLLSHVRGLGSF